MVEALEVASVKEPHFEPIDFSDLHELLAAAGDPGDSSDPAVLALSRGVQETKRMSAEVDGRLATLEEESVEDYVSSFQAFEDLHREIIATDCVLEKMEKMLGTFQSDLSSISDEIKMLQGDSLQMNMKLRNRRALQGLMGEYVSSVVVSPVFVRQICEEEINEAYLEHVAELNRKLEHVKQQEMQKLPSVAQSLPQLEGLRTKAVSRIKDFLLQKISALKKPKTNLQILQRNVLVKFKLFTQFLAEHHPQVSEEVQQNYVSTMREVYLKQFRTYVSSLQRLELEYTPTKLDLLVSSEWLSSVGAGQRLLGNLGLGRSVNIKDRGNVFSLSGRDAILKELEKDPIIAHTQRDKGKYYHEQLFRSHQMLLMDTATSEFLFLKDFFDAKDHTLFGEVFAKTEQFFRDSLETFLASCWDSVGLSLLTLLVDHYRNCMDRRDMSCLDSYLDALQLMIRPRLRMVLEENVKSLRRGHQQYQPVPANTHPHLIVRRYAELAASLYALGREEAGSLSELLQQPLAAMQQEAVILMTLMASKLENPQLGGVFLVNNYDLVLTVFHERQLPRSVTATVAGLIGKQVELFVEAQLQQHYPDLVNFVKSTEPLVAGIDEGVARSTPTQAPPKGVDLQRAEQVVRSFAQNWKTETDRIHQYVMASFTNFSNGMEILKQVLTQLLLYYTRMQKILAKAFPRRSFDHELVSTTTILMEIKQYSRSF